MSDNEEPKQLYHNLTPAEVQKIKIENLIKKADKLAESNLAKKVVQDPSKTSKDFQNHVSGSSAGAGSGEFHVYRAHRRKEYARLKIMEVMAKQEKEDLEFKERQEQIRKEEEERTAKKRAKRNKRKDKIKPKEKHTAVEKKEVLKEEEDEKPKEFKMVPNTDI